MCQALQWAFINCCFIYFPQQIYQVNIYSFYQLGGIEKHRNQEMNAFILKTSESSTRECCMTVTGNVRTLSRLIEKLHLRDLGKQFTYVLLCIHSHTSSVPSLSESKFQRHTAMLVRVFAESLQRFKISVLTVSVP